jgi:undecaprenyl-diphosphatase
MDILLLLKAAIMGIVEGITEFLPVSSTGHLIVVGSIIGFTGPIAKTFEIAIQMGAMIAVVWEYRRRFFGIVGLTPEKQAPYLVFYLFIGILPAILVGLLIGKGITKHLFHPVPVAMAFIIGGFAILWIERRHKSLYGSADLQGKRQARVKTMDDITFLDAIKVGLFQCIALIPGVSRSGSTIMGAVLVGFSRKAATEFSFFLGVPILVAATTYTIYDQWQHLHIDNLPPFIMGFFFAFISALACIRWLIDYISKKDFIFFAWYRIGFGFFILFTAYTNWFDWT